MVIPSMRPRPFGRGNIGQVSALERDVGDPSMRPRPFGRGNEPAQPFQPAQSGPSMRPRPFGRGNSNGDAAPPSRPLTFNAATSFRPWKSRFQDGSRPPAPPAFNAATSFRPWKSRFQGGSRPPAPPAFNAATSFRPWKLRIRSPSGLVLCAPFNAATSFRPWKFDVQAGDLEEPLTLQCGHVLSAVEIRTGRCRRGCHFRPSMRPRPFGRGNVAAPVPAHAGEGLPSMRPRPFGRGNSKASVSPAWRCPSLQCGHVLSAVEMPNSAWPTSTDWTLQCGHVLSAVEIGSRQGHPRHDCVPFNAATSFRPWKFVQCSDGPAPPDTFNAATSFRPWKCRALPVCRLGNSCPSMRPRPFGRGNED